VLFDCFQHCPFFFIMPPMAFSAEAGAAVKTALRIAATIVSFMIASPLDNRRCAGCREVIAEEFVCLRQKNAEMRHTPNCYQPRAPLDSNGDARSGDNEKTQRSQSGL
jgi:hypothetical protein